MALDDKLKDTEITNEQIVNLTSVIKEGKKNLSVELSGRNLGREHVIIDHIFSFIGLAGGVGTSTLLANTAAMLKKDGFSVLIIDTNILYPIQHSFFKIKQDAEINDPKDLCAHLSGTCELGEAIRYTHNNQIGVMVANNRGFIDLVDLDTKEASRNLDLCLDKLRSLFDFILIDCSNSIQNELVNTALFKSDSIIAVMDENIECLSNYNRMTTAMGSCGIEFGRIQVVFNKKTSIYYNSSIIDQFGISLLNILPFDLGVIESGLRGEIFCERGESTARTASVFVERIKELSKSIQDMGGTHKENDISEVSK